MRRWLDGIGSADYREVDREAILYPIISPRTGFQAEEKLNEALYHTASTAEEEAYLHLLTAIRGGKYSPGDRLVADDIAQQISMSRMPVRAALRRLASEGLVYSRPNRGYIVSRLTEAEMFEIFEIRSVLEGLAARLATPHVDPLKLEKLVADMDASGLSGADDWVTRHRDFHEYVARFSGRPKLIRQIAALHTQIEPYLRVWFHHLNRPLQSRREHESLVAALVAGDPAKVDEVFQNHVMETTSEVVEFLHLK